MRKFLIRWWLTPNWEQEAHTRMIEAWSPLAKYCGRGLSETMRSAVAEIQLYDDIFHEPPEERERKRLSLEELFSNPIPFSEGKDYGLF